LTNERRRTSPKRKNPEKPTTTRKKTTTTTTTNEVLQNFKTPLSISLIFFIFKFPPVFFSFCNNKKIPNHLNYFFWGSFSLMPWFPPIVSIKKKQFCFSKVQNFLYWKKEVWVFVFLFSFVLVEGGKARAAFFFFFPPHIFNISKI
jgi:hypothetical protein